MAQNDYNATLTQRIDINPALAILRVVPDAGVPRFVPGQYAVLGLTKDEPRVPEAEPEDVAAADAGKLIRRAYSVSSSSRQGEFFEFYVMLVPSGELTPRLFALREGARLWTGPKVVGMFTLDKIAPEKSLLLVATGTGLAPYMSMIRTELTANISRRFILVHGARLSSDLGYRSELEALSRQWDHVAYLPAITRPCKDPTWTGHSGRLQQLVEQGALDDAAEEHIIPERFDVFLCGNPGMIESVGALMAKRGFVKGTKRDPGTLHIEEYWK
jgi:ferredoxin--NADP+ reductase